MIVSENNDLTSKLNRYLIIKFYTIYFVLLLVYNSLDELQNIDFYRMFQNCVQTVIKTI